MPTSSYYGPNPCIPTTCCACIGKYTLPIFHSCVGSVVEGLVVLSQGLANFAQPLLSSAGVGSGGFNLAIEYLVCPPLSGTLAGGGGDNIVGVSFNYSPNTYITEASPPRIITAQNTIEEFLPDGSGGYSSAGNNTSAVLTRTGQGTPSDQFTLISRDGTVSVFYGTYTSIPTPGRLQRFTDRFGNTQIFTWVVMGGKVRLTIVTDSYGRQILFTYDACQNYLLTQVLDFDGRQVNFQYDSVGRLVAVVGPSITRGANNNANVFPDGTATVFKYDVNNARPERQNDLIAVYDPNQVAPYLSAGRVVNVPAVYASATPRRTFSYYNDPTDTFHYGKVQQVTESTSGSATIGSGAWGFIYVNTGLPSNLIDPSDPIVSRTIVTDRNGNQTTYDFNLAQMVVRKEAFATRGKNSLEASSWLTWMKYNSHNQPMLVVMPEGNSVAYEYEDETNTIAFGGVPYGRRIGLLKSVTRLPGNTIGIPSRSGSGPSGAVQNELTSRQFNDPLFGQTCASIEERGNDIDTGLYFPPQNGGTTPTDADRSRYATINYFDYQKDAAATVQADAVLQSQLGLTSTQIGNLITFVNGQMTATDGTGGIPAGFERALGDVNGDGTGDGTSFDARHQGAVVKIAPPSVRQLIPNGEGAYPQAILFDLPIAYYRLGELSGTTAADSSGHGHSGIYIGGYTLGQTGALVRDSNDSVLLNGSTGYVDCGLTPIPAPFTLEAWIAMTSLPSDTYRLICSRDDATPGGVDFYIDSSGILGFYFASAAASSFPANVPADGHFHHVVVIHDGTTVTFYIDGAAAGGGALAAPGSSTIHLTLGVLGEALIRFFAGRMDEVAIYTHALSADRVLAHYNAGTGADGWVLAEQSREELFTSNARGQGTTATDPEGNLTVFVRYPENDPEGAGQFLVPTLSNQQYGFVKEIHVDADPNRVMSVVGSDGDLIAFIGNKIPRTNTPGVYQDLVTTYQASGSSSGGCASCAYDPLGNPLSMTDPRGNTTNYDRNELGEVYRTTSAAPYNYQTETSYDANRNVVQVDTQDVVVQYTSDNPADPAYAQFTPTGSGFSADLPTRPGPGGSVRPGWFSNLFSYDLLDNKIEDDTDATGSVPASLVTTFVHDFNQNLIAITKPMGNLVEYDYDERDLRIATRVGYNPSLSQPGAVTVMAHDGNGNLLDVIGPIQRGSPSQALSVVIADAFRSGTALTHIGDWATAKTFDGFDRMIQSMDAVGGTMANTFDPGGRVIASQTNGTANGSTPTDRTGSLNLLLASGATNFDEAGRAYEQLQNVFLNTGISGGSPTNALPSTRSVTHTGGGLATNATTNSHTATVTLTNTSGNTSYVLSRTVFDRASRTTNAATDNGALTTYAYDGANRQVTMTDALGNKVLNLFDANGNVVQSMRVELCTITGVTTTESFVSATFYDCLNRAIITAMQGPDGTFTPSLAIGSCCSWATLPVSCPGWSTPTGTIFDFFGYDSRGNRTNLIDPKANTTIWQYDGASRRLRSLQSLRKGGSGSNAIFETVTTTSGYDANSRLIRLIDDNGGTSMWSYDTLDRQTVMTFHDGSTRTNTFDLASDLIGYVDENGSVFTNTFDVLGRKTAVSIARATGVIGSNAQAFQYDGLSRMTLASDSVGSVVAGAGFYFDSLSRVIEEVQSYGS